MTKYYETAGKINTLETLNIAKKFALERGIKTIAIASIRGKTAEIAIDVFRNTKLNIIITGCNGCDGCPLFSEKIRKRIENVGFKLIFAPENSVPYPPAAQLAYRRICEGMKVCVHLAISLAERGEVDIGEEIVAIAGTGWKGYPNGGGSDTAVIIEAQKSETFFSYEPLPDHKLHGRKIKEILCRPR